MNKQSLKDFLKWLDSASEDEILAKRQLVLDKRHQVSTQDARSDVRLILRLIDEELIARMETSALSKS